MSQMDRATLNVMIACETVIPQLYLRWSTAPRMGETLQVKRFAIRDITLMLYDMPNITSC